MTTTAAPATVISKSALLGQTARYEIVRTERLSAQAGNRGTVEYDLPVLADNADGSRVTFHDFGPGYRELHCNCAAWGLETGCDHVRDVQAKIAAPAAVKLEPVTA